MIVQPECRLLNVVGAGGVGKTRLALQLAQDQVRAERYRDGVYFVPLEALTSAEQVPARIAEVLNVSLQGQREPVDLLTRHLVDKRMLLVLDNFEHLLAGADLLSRLVRACSELKLVVTSRERLSLAEEWPYPVHGLGLPRGEVGIDEALEADAVRLFMQRARRADPHFAGSTRNLESMVAICELVGGYPLGIELAAVWVQHVPIAEIAHEISENLDFLASPLRNVSERHRSLRAAFEGSWERLNEREREVFKRLSVFRGGFLRDAAGTVAAATLPILASLVNKSLLSLDEAGRYEVHELLRQFAAAKLTADEGAQADARKRHSHHYLSFLQGFEGDLKGARQLEAANEIEAELGNIRTGWDWAVENADVVSLSGCAIGLFLFSDMRGQAREAVAAYQQALVRVTALEANERRDDLTHARARLLARRGVLISRLDHVNESPLEFVMKSADLLRPVRERYPEDYAFAVLWASHFHHFVGNHVEATRALEESAAVATEAGEDFMVGLTQLGWGQVLEFQGAYRAAEPHFQRSIQAFSRLGDRRHKSYAMNNWGRASYGMGNYDQAERLIQEALAIRWDLDDTYGIIFSLEDLGKLALMRGHYQSAEEYLTEGLELAERVGYAHRDSDYNTTLGKLAYLLGNLEQATLLLQSNLDGRRANGVLRGQPAALNGLAQVAYLEGRLDEAQELLDESLGISEDLGNIGDQASTLRYLGHLCQHRHPEDPAQARKSYRSVLELTSEAGAAPIALDVLMGWAEAGHDQGALELLELVRIDDRSEFETREKAKRLAAELVPTLPPVEVEAAVARGKELELWETAASLISG